MTGIERKNFDQPDEVEDYGEHGSSNRVTLGIAHDSTVWRPEPRPAKTLGPSGHGSKRQSELFSEREATG